MKKQYHVVNVHIANLEHAEFFQLVTETKEVVAAFNKGAKKEDMYGTSLAALEPLLVAFQATLHRAKASDKAKALEVADQERDDAFMTLSSLIRAFARVKDPATKEAYSRLYKLLQQYKATSSLNYEKETEAINHLLKQLRDETNQAAVNRLHLTSHVTALSQAQKVFEQAYKARLAEQGDSKPQQAKKIRQELHRIYDLLVDFTAVYSAAYPEKKAYQDLHQQLNTIRDRYRHLQKTSKSDPKGGDKEQLPQVPASPSPAALEQDN